MEEEEEAMTEEEYEAMLAAESSAPVATAPPPPAKEEEDLLSPEEVARIKRKIESYAPWMDVDPEVPSRLLTDALPPTAAAPRAHAADRVSACGRPLRVPRRRVRTAKTRRRRRWTR